MTTHTTALTTTNENGFRWIALHNGDWSGPIILRKLRVNPEGDPPKVISEVTVPGLVAQALCAAIIHNAWVQVAEELNLADLILAKLLPVDPCQGDGVSSVNEAEEDRDGPEA